MDDVNLGTNDPARCAARVDATLPTARSWRAPLPHGHRRQGAHPGRNPAQASGMPQVRS